MYPTATTDHRPVRRSPSACASNASPAPQSNEPCENRIIASMVRLYPAGKSRKITHDDVDLVVCAMPVTAGYKTVGFATNEGVDVQRAQSARIVVSGSVSMLGVVALFVGSYQPQLSGVTPEHLYDHIDQFMPAVL